MNGVNPWQPASFVSPTTTLQNTGTLPSAHGVLAISAAAGAGGITFATNFHNDVYVFQASTATNVSTTLSIFENPYYFEFEPSASRMVRVTAQFSNLGSRCQYGRYFGCCGKKHWRKCKQRFGNWCYQCYASVS